MTSIAIFIGGLIAAASAITVWGQLPLAEGSDGGAEVFLLTFPGQFVGHHLAAGQVAMISGAVIVCLAFLQGSVVRIPSRRVSGLLSLVAALGVIGASAFFIIDKRDQVMDGYVTRVAGFSLELDAPFGLAGKEQEADEDRRREFEQDLFETTPEDRSAIAVEVGPGPFLALSGGLIALVGSLIGMRREHAQPVRRSSAARSSDVPPPPP